MEEHQNHSIEEELVVGDSTTRRFNGQEFEVVHFTREELLESIRSLFGFDGE